MGDLWMTAAKKPPLTSLIINAWLEMTRRLPDMRANKEFKPALEHLAAYAEASLADNGVEQLGPAELCLRNPRALKILTTGVDPLFREDQISPKKILYYAVQLAGMPGKDRFMDGDAEHDGPAAILRTLPTRALQEKWGDNMGALQRVAIISRELKNKTVYNWSLGAAHIINEALLDFAEEHKLMGYMRRISVRPSRKTKQQWNEAFAELKATRDGREGEDGLTPVEALQKLLAKKSPQTADLVAMFNLIGERIEKMDPAIGQLVPARLPAQAGAPLTPEQALAHAVKSGSVKSVAPASVAVKAAGGAAKRRRSAPAKTAA